MECPYCRGELEPGSVSTGRDPIFWYPRGKEINFFPTWGRVKRRGGFCVTGSYGNAEAWYCQVCNRLVVFNAK